MKESGIERYKIFLWTLFDFANTAFSVMIVTFAFPLYYKIIVCENSVNADFYWGLNVSLSMLISALVSPVLGAAADFSQNRRRILFIFTFISVFCTGLLYFSSAGMVLFSSVLFIFANIGFESGIVFYDSFLPDLTKSKNYGRVSGYGFAMGYLGAFAILLITFSLMKDGINPSDTVNIRSTFLITAAFFMIFAIPAFFVLKERKRTDNKVMDYWKIGFERILLTIKNLKEYKNITRFLLSFFLYNDAILTVIAFASIVAVKTFQFSVLDLVFFFLAVQSTAVVGSIIFGIITDKIGSKKTIIITLSLWILTIIFAAFVGSKPGFYVVGFLAGMLLGSSQASSRSLMAKLTPKEHEAEFFGFYDGLCGKASAIIGPLLFGLISSIANSQRIAILSLTIFFSIGLYLIRNVKEEIVNS
jgi:MFS transporter, UMF1 family